MKNKFLIYAFCRKNGTFYYIGKGDTKRAYSSYNRVIKPPKDKSNILILHQNLDEQTAFKYEMDLIKFYGRFDNGEGLLRNLTDGGEGVSGWIPSKKWRIIKSNSMKGERNPFYGKTHTKETKKLLSKYRKGKFSGKKCFFYGKHFFGPNNPMYGKSRPDLAKRNRELSIAKGTKWYNDGKIEIRCIDGQQPKNFNCGRISRKWYTNGIDSIMCIPGKNPENFFPGRTIIKK